MAVHNQASQAKPRRPKHQAVSMPPFAVLRRPGLRSPALRGPAMEAIGKYYAWRDPARGWIVVNRETSKTFPIRFGDDEQGARDLAATLTGTQCAGDAPERERQ